MKKIITVGAMVVIVSIAAVAGYIGFGNSSSYKTGTIQYVDLEGGFYGIIGDDGNNYDPVNLANEYEEDGLRIRFSSKILEDQVNIHMWGTLIELIDVQKI